MSGRRMPKQQRNTSKQDYSTPAVFIEPVKRRLRIRGFAFDFAADASNNKAVHYWTAKDDALGFTPRKWREQLDRPERYYEADPWGWLNPPFKDIDPWAQACLGLRAHGGSIAFLVPAAVGSNWFRDYVDPNLEVICKRCRQLTPAIGRFGGRVDSCPPCSRAHTASYRGAA